MYSIYYCLLAQNANATTLQRCSCLLRFTRGFTMISPGSSVWQNTHRTRTVFNISAVQLKWKPCSCHFSLILHVFYVFSGFFPPVFLCLLHSRLPLHTCSASPSLAFSLFPVFSHSLPSPVPLPRSTCTSPPRLFCAYSSPVFSSNLLCSPDDPWCLLLHRLCSLCDKHSMYWLDFHPFWTLC